jgi:hypothetical protein
MRLRPLLQADSRSRHSAGMDRTWRMTATGTLYAWARSTSLRHRSRQSRICVGDNGSRRPHRHGHCVLMATIIPIGCDSGVL